MAKDIPDVFEGMVEVNETYLGGQKKNKRKNQLLKEKIIFGKESKRGFGTTKQPVFGILWRSGKIGAEVVEDIEAKDLLKNGQNRVCSGRLWWIWRISPYRVGARKAGKANRCF